MIVPAQQEVLDETLQQYNAMQLGVYDLLRAQTELLDAELEHVEVLRQYWTARATVDALVRGHQLGVTTDAASPMMPSTTSADASPGGH